MLRRTRPPQGMDSSEGRVVLDGFSDEFSISLVNNPALAGITPPDNDSWGPHVRQLWELSVLLIRYCESTESNRRELLNVVKRKATALAVDLESMRR